MIKLDTALLDEILGTPQSDLAVSPSAWGHLAGFVSGHTGMDLTKENMKSSVFLVRTLLHVGYTWGRKDALAEIESIGKSK